jgi:hypothetical protein
MSPVEDHSTVELRLESGLRAGVIDVPIPPFPASLCAVNDLESLGTQILCSSAPPCRSGRCLGLFLCQLHGTMSVFLSWFRWVR